MITLEQNVFHAFLTRQDERAWSEVISHLYPYIHPVDQAATTIWFSFWPLRLSKAFQDSLDPIETSKRLQLDGNWRLEDQIDSSIGFFYGSRYWAVVKKAILKYAESASQPDSMSLEKQILHIASSAAVESEVGESFIVGITAAGVMILQQVGMGGLVAVSRESIQSIQNRSAEHLLKERNGKSGGGLRGLLGFQNKKHEVTFDESKPGCCFVAHNGQDLSMASSSDERDYRSKDHRRVAGPIPAECRSGACGYCWIGVLGGKENLSEITEFEKSRLRYFGYVSRDTQIERHPHIRLACQSKCYGNASVVVSPWNGVLDGRKR